MSLRTAHPTDWPILLDSSDLAEILDCSRRSAQRKMGKGLLGPFIPLEGKRYIRREVFLETLKKREQRGQVAVRNRR